MGSPRRHACPPVRFKPTIPWYTSRFGIDAENLECCRVCLCCCCIEEGAAVLRWLHSYDEVEKAGGGWELLPDSVYVTEDKGKRSRSSNPMLCPSRPAPVQVETMTSCFAYTAVTFPIYTSDPTQEAVQRQYVNLPLLRRDLSPSPFVITHQVFFKSVLFFRHIVLDQPAVASPPMVGVATSNPPLLRVLQPCRTTIDRPTIVYVIAF